ncbi:MAG TPA: MarR family transcriptional regulator [Bacillota bacterium]|jgi:DNA-binding MarR family transcriptional regulator|nr:MarR family transcriptional regulator [Bacillota bacterium]HOL09035.1 MarR family transcriptional regulator [Bacillota bacterium]HPO96710.1 MarR family transcriptional regulator [Bacillota bacterium]
MTDVKKAKELRELIRGLERKIGLVDKNQVTCCGVTMAQCHALVEIGRAKQITLNELAELLGLDNSTMSRTVNNLVNDGLVIREVHPEDRRYVTIRLTEAGQKIFAGIESSMDLYYQKVLKEIPEGAREEVLNGLNLLLTAIGKVECCL